MAKYKLEAWGAVALTDWHHYVECGIQRGTRLVQGYLKAVPNEDLPIDLRGGQHARWVVMVYLSPTAARPFFIVPGCKVASVQIFEEPVAGKFIQ